MRRAREAMVRTRSVKSRVQMRLRPARRCGIPPACAQQGFRFRSIAWCQPARDRPVTAALNVPVRKRRFDDRRPHHPIAAASGQRRLCDRALHETYGGSPASGMIAANRECRREISSAGIRSQVCRSLQRIRPAGRGHAGCDSRLVGTAGFEPTTFRPPAGCATKLRYVPKPQFYLHRPYRGRSSRTLSRMTMRIGLPLKSNSSRSRRSMNRCQVTASGPLVNSTKVGGEVSAWVA